jgi:hypothetical protein
VIEIRKKSKIRIALDVFTAFTDQLISSVEFLDQARKKTQYFTRNRKMPFKRLIAFILNMIKSSIQTCLDTFFENIGQEDVCITQQSFSEARDKIKWEAFRELFRQTRDLIYTGYTNTWHGYRLMAIDGTKIQLPDDKSLRKHFGTTGKGNTAATGQASALYDIINKILIDVQLSPMIIDEREQAFSHILGLCTIPSFCKECIIFDRGYASFELLKHLTELNIHYVFRLKRHFDLAIDKLPEGDHYTVLHRDGQADIRVRVIKFALPSGEVETLITDITDKRMGTSAFKDLYFMRWPIETKYNEIKNKLEVENFSGRTMNAIMQDFFVTMYMANAISVAYWESQSSIDEQRESKDNKYNYHVNVNQAIGAFKDRFILAVLEDDPIRRAQMIKRILRLVTKQPSPTRPNRSIPRNAHPRNAKFRHNRKSNC